MSQETKRDDLDPVRRKLLRSSLAAGGFLAAGHLPYVKPAVKSFFGVRTAWAQPTGVTSAQFIGDLADLGQGLGTGQDAWELTTTQPDTELTIDVTITAGNAAPEIGLFEPGVAVTGVNLLTGIPGGYTGPFPVVIKVAVAGAYTLAVEDSNINALQVPFSYQLDVTADMPIVPGPQLISDGPETLRPTGG